MTLIHENNAMILYLFKVKEKNFFDQGLALAGVTLNEESVFFCSNMKILLFLTIVSIYVSSKLMLVEVGDEDNGDTLERNSTKSQDESDHDYVIGMYDYIL